MKSSGRLAGPLIAFLLALVAPPAAAAEWERPSVWEAIPMAAACTLIAVDVGQSIDGTRHPDRYHEGNFFLGPHPTPATFVGAGLLVSSAGVIAWYNLPAKYRWIVPAVLITAETIAVVHNAQIGLSVRF